MADLIRRMSVLRGFDPREFTLLAFGGGGPVHCAAVAREAGMRSMIVPLPRLAAVWSAFGASASDVTHVYQQSGNVLVKLTVSNCKGSAVFELPVTIGEDNRPVLADFTWQPSAVITGEQITFSALTGTDYGDPDAFTWQFSDETGTRSGADVARTFACSGTVQVTTTTA